MKSATPFFGCLLAAMMSYPPLPARAENQQAVRQHLDTWIPEKLQEYGIPGAVVAVVRLGEEPLLAGYGAADLENGCS